MKLKTLIKEMEKQKINMPVYKDSEIESDIALTMDGEEFGFSDTKSSLNELEKKYSKQIVENILKKHNKLRKSRVTSDVEARALIEATKRIANKRIN